MALAKRLHTSLAVLPSQTGNEYQGMHYHGKLVVDAQQADQGPFKHGDGGEEPENITVNVPAKILDQSDASNPKFLEDVEIPMTFDLGTEVRIFWEYAERF